VLLLSALAVISISSPLPQIHSIHQRRQVVGRRKPFDQLVMELKMSSKPRERPPLSREVPDGGSVNHENPLHYKSQMTNSSILRSELLLLPAVTNIQMYLVK